MFNDDYNQIFDMESDWDVPDYNSMDHEQCDGGVVGKEDFMEEIRIVEMVKRKLNV